MSDNNNKPEISSVKPTTPEVTKMDPKDGTSASAQKALNDEDTKAPGDAANAAQSTQADVSKR